MCDHGKNPLGGVDPAILDHPAIQPSLDANWMGLIGHFSNQALARKIGRFWPNSLLKDMFTGIPLSDTDHHGAPYSLTEEFNAVYRLDLDFRLSRDKGF